MRCPTLLSPRRRPLIAAICGVAVLQLLDLVAPTSSFVPAAAAAPSAGIEPGTVWATPHSQYSSSIGVLGCKVDTNRVAYWPGSVDCDKICISLSNEGRTVHLLRVDQSEGAFDISYDAWNYLVSGFPAHEKPTAGGAIAMDYKEANPSDCASLLHTPGSRLPLSASNSMNFLASCLAQPSSWVARNFVLYNVLDPICSWGHDEECTLDWPTANQPKCPSGLGVPSVLNSTPVYNVEYPSGKVVLASSGQVVDNPPSDNAAAPAAAHGVDNGGRRGGGALTAVALGAALSWCLYAVVGLL